MAEHGAGPHAFTAASQRPSSGRFACPTAYTPRCRGCSRPFRTRTSMALPSVRTPAARRTTGRPTPPRPPATSSTIGSLGTPSAASRGSKCPNLSRHGRTMALAASRNTMRRCAIRARLRVPRPAGSEAHGGGGLLRRVLSLSNLDKVFYPGDGVHQGPGDRVLHAHRARAALPARAPPHAQALSRSCPGPSSTRSSARATGRSGWRRRPYGRATTGATSLTARVASARCTSSTRQSVIRR